jgi:signal transduction histidine kinase
VNKEIDSSINLAVQLITFGFSQASFNEIERLPKLNSLNQTRHLSIQLKEPSGRIINFAHNNRTINDEEKPPQWFINLVATDHPRLNIKLTTAHKKADIKQATDSIINVCNHLMTGVRSMIYQLHPLVLTELGLKATMEDLLNQGLKLIIQTFRVVDA